MESALMMVPRSSSASASASADLPLAVGPAISTARCAGDRTLIQDLRAMTLVATLISNPAVSALDGATIERARDVLPAAQAPTWLEPGVAADIPFTATQHGAQTDDSRAFA